jgi:uncharacterized membrane protein
MQWQLAFVIAVIGNIIPIPLILMLLGKVEKWLRKYKWCDRNLDKLFEYTRKRATKTVKKYEIIGL